MKKGSAEGRFNPDVLQAYLDDPQGKLDREEVVSVVLNNGAGDPTAIQITLNNENRGMVTECLGYLGSLEEKLRSAGYDKYSARLAALQAEVREWQLEGRGLDDLGSELYRRMS